MATEYAEYIKNVKKKQENAKNQLERRRLKALKYAEKIVDLLYSKYNTIDVYLFGSVLEKGKFREDSDIDILVFGLEDRNYFEAINEIDNLINSEFDLDLICGESCKDSILELIMERSTKIDKEGRHQKIN